MSPSIEEWHNQKKLAEQKRYARIFSDPVALDEENKKRWIRYAKSKEKTHHNKIYKRDQKKLRKKWRKQYHKKVAKKKAVTENATPSAWAESITSQIRKQIERKAAKHYYLVRELQNRKAALGQKVEMYCKWCSRLTAKMASNSPQGKLNRDFKKYDISSPVM